MSKASERKARLHEELIVAALARIAQSGVIQLRARDLAADVGCSLGTIYNVFADLNAIVLHANLRILERIDQVMEETEDDASLDPTQRLVRLAWRYFDFAADHNNTWRSLFDHPFPADYQLPDWMIEGQQRLLRHIEKPLRQLSPSTDDEEVGLITRTLFSSTHGIVELSLELRTIGVPKEAVRQQLEFLVHSFVKGYSQSNE